MKNNIFHLRLTFKLNHKYNSVFLCLSSNSMHTCLIMILNKFSIINKLKNNATLTQRRRQLICHNNII